MMVNNSKSYLGYLNKLLDKYNNIYYRSISKMPFNDAYSALAGEMESSYTVPNFKVGDRARIKSYKNIFSRGYTKDWSRKIFFIDYGLKTNPWTYKIQDLNGKI